MHLKVHMCSTCPSLKSLSTSFSSCASDSFQLNGGVTDREELGLENKRGKREKKQLTLAFS